MIAMSALGELPRLDLAIFCDLGWERQVTYDTLDFYSRWFERRGVEVVTLKTGDIREKGSQQHIHMPFWTLRGGHLRRQCTRHFKLAPMRRYLRQRLGFDPSKAPHPKAGTIEQWIGITIDEWKRAGKSRVQYIKNRYPLLDRRFSRNDCADWLMQHKLPVPEKSACIGCPFRSPSEWLEMRENASNEFDEAVAFDEKIRDHPLDGMKSEQLFLYRYIDLSLGVRVPLADADLQRDALRERPAKQLPLFW